MTSGWVQKGGVSGLGLSMAKHYVERVGGNIGVESSVGEGSTFFFSIPFPLVPRDDNNKTEVLLSNSEASESTRNDFSVPRKTTARRRKSMEQEGTFVQTIAATKPGESKSKQKDSGHRQRKVLLVEDTRINRVGFFSFVSYPIDFTVCGCCFLLFANCSSLVVKTLLSTWGLQWSGLLVLIQLCCDNGFCRSYYEKFCRISTYFVMKQRMDKLQ